MTNSSYERTPEGYMRTQAGRIDRLEHRLNGSSGGYFYGQSKMGFLDPEYRGWGAALVRITDPTAPLTGPYPWRTPYIPNGSRRVSLVWSGSDWQIAGQSTDETIMLDYDETKVDIYGERAGDNFWNLRPRATKLAMSGLVVLSGMMMSVGSLPGGTIIATLPEGMRPPQTLIFTVEYGDFARTVYIFPSGNITISSPPAANAYLSLDGIAFHAAGVGDWITVGDGGSAFGPNFGEWTPDPQFGPCAFYKDPWGFVWWRGLARVNVATSADNTPIVTVPAAYRSESEQHFRSASNDVFGGLGSRPTDGLNWKSGSPGTVGTYITLTSATFVTTDALSLNPWKAIKTYNNGWVAYGAQFPTPAYLRREDGLAMTKGLIRAGTINAKAAGMTQEEMWPTGGKIIIAAYCAQERGRLDINAARETEPTTGPGALIGRGVSNAWFSWDGLKWVP